MDNIRIKQLHKNKGLQFAARTWIGKRDIQEDMASIFEDNDLFIATLCDGMGGLHGGEQASSSAILSMENLYHLLPVEKPSAFFDYAIQFMNSTVCNLRDKNGYPLDAGTTVVSCLIQKDELYWMSVGDSRLYVIRGNDMIQATRDHNQRLILDAKLSNQRISLEQYKKEVINGDSLISYIGSENVEWQDVSSSPFKLLNGDVLLLCSDGLYNGMSKAEIIDILNLRSETDSLEDASMKIEASLRNKHIQDQDNMTFILIEIGR